MSAHGGDERPNLPPPTLWPVGFAVGIACILVGLIVSWPAVVVGAVITLVFGFLWIRDVTQDVRGRPVAVEPETREVADAPTRPARPAPAIPAHVGEAALPQMSDEEIERFPRSKFLEFSTLGIGAAIGGIVTAPVLGFMVLPAFSNQDTPDVDLGPLENFPEGEWRITSYMLDPDAGEVSRRTAYIRNNGTIQGKPSFTVLYSRCVHLGCPVQPNGPVADDEKKTYERRVDIIPARPSGFGCPCHGGQYDDEGNRTAGPPVRALDRFSFSIRDGHLWLGEPYSVSHVEGAGASARIKKYRLAAPGVHVDGPEAWLYPIPVPS